LANLSESAQIGKKKFAQGIVGSTLGYFLLWPFINSFLNRYASLSQYTLEFTSDGDPRTLLLSMVVVLMLTAYLAEQIFFFGTLIFGIILRTLITLWWQVEGRATGGILVTVETGVAPVSAAVSFTAKLSLTLVTALGTHLVRCVFLLSEVVF
jgi:hypothetical protein